MSKYSKLIIIDDNPDYIFSMETFLKFFVGRGPIEKLWIARCPREFIRLF